MSAAENEIKVMDENSEVIALKNEEREETRRGGRTVGGAGKGNDSVVSVGLAR